MNLCITDKPNVCIPLPSGVQCAKCFSVKETLNRHMKIHTGDRKHACTHCDKTFIQAQQLRAHLFYHTGENGHDCGQCNQRFNKRTRLEAHIKKVHQEGKQLTCDVCQETFRFKGKLTVHLRKHIRDAKETSLVRTVASAVHVNKEKPTKGAIVKKEKNAVSEDAIESEHYVDEIVEENKKTEVNVCGENLPPVTDEDELIVPDVIPVIRRTTAKRQTNTEEKPKTERQTVKVKMEPGELVYISKTDIVVNNVFNRSFMSARLLSPNTHLN